MKVIRHGLSIGIEGVNNEFLLSLKATDDVQQPRVIERNRPATTFQQIATITLQGAPCAPLLYNGRFMVRTAHPAKNVPGFSF